MAPHSNTLAWKIPWKEKSGRLWSVESLKSRTRLEHPHFHFYALEKDMATHSSVLAWRIPGTGEPGGLPSMGSHRVGHDWSDLSAVTARAEVQSLGREDPLKKSVETHSSIPAWRIPKDRGAWQGTVHRVSKGWTQVKRLSTLCGT